VSASAPSLVLHVPHASVVVPADIAAELTLRFAGGKGNVIRQAAMLRDLGVKPTKALPTRLVDAAMDEPIALPTGAGDPAEA